MKWDAKTIVALTGLVSVLLGGVEMRLTMSRLEDKTTRMEERLVRIEREVGPASRTVAVVTHTRTEATE